MGIGLLLLAVAAGLLLAGAELFAEHAASAGRRLGVTGLAVGVLLAGAEPEEMLTAIDGRNIQGMLDAGERIDEVCEACHSTFWYPNQVIPEFPD